LFWKMKPICMISNQPISETKQSKDHVTVLLTCNTTGTEKLKLYSFTNMKIHNWMQVSIWNNYIKKLDTRMRMQNRNIILLVDNVLTHTLYETTHVTNITIEFLPPNTTAHLQPCDQGIINSFKTNEINLDDTADEINLDDTIFIHYDNIVITTEIRTNDEILVAVLPNNEK
ncbi:4044_t:CDS:2, partial [Diversispora eburnea]